MPELMEPGKASLREIFSEAAEIADLAARAAFLDSACREDAALRARVERLLLADSQAGEFLCDHTDLPGRSFEKIGDRIGRYRLREQLGRGGCGTVYLAEQEEPVRRQVALKVIKLGMDTQSVVARFEAERQVLALMDHPNIARVLDAGATDTGRPFFVMELVRGIPLVDYCEQNGLSFRQRLELFIQVCQAVQHAHQKGIIHRDLKPSNILVAMTDGAPAPKIIDFGIAKATEQRLTDHTLTNLHQFIGTPAYMSPEQLGIGELDVDTRSDIYSLGVILYELVTGQPPFAPKTLTQAGLDEMRRIIREVDPPRPSTTIARSLDSNRLPSTWRPTRDQLGAVRSDLDWIVMKCLEKDRARRYETASSLATDIRRHLDNETISARPPTALYRFQKIVRRNPRVAVLTTLLFLALAIGLSGVIFMNVRLASANRQKDQANDRLAANLRGFESQKVEDLVDSGKRSDALALLSSLLRQNPRDAVAATRIFSMLNGGNFALPKTMPFRHTASVNSVFASADGQRALTASDDGTARLWDLRSGSLLVSLTHTGRVTSARFADSDRCVMTQCQDGTFWLWDADGTKRLLEATQPPNRTVTPALSRDGKRLALPASDVAVRVWDVPGRRPICSLESPARILYASFNPDASIIALSASDRSIVVWRIRNPGSAEQLAKLALKDSPSANWIEFSPDGRTLIARFQESVAFWDAQTWSKLREFKAHGGEILASEISSDSQRLITAPWGAPLKIWDVASGKAVGRPIEAEQPHCYFRINPNGKNLITWSQSGVLRVWDAMTGQALSEPFEHAGPITKASFAQDGRSILSSSQDGTAQAWDVQHGRSVLPILQPRQPYSSACFSRDGRYVLGTDGRQALKFDAVTGAQVGEPIIHANPIYRIKSSPDGKSFVTATWESSSARVWDTQSGAARTPLLKHSDRLLGVAFSPNGRLVATASQDTTARIWDAESGDPRSPPLSHDGDCLYVAFSSDSRRLISSSVDGTARLWSTEDGHAIWPQSIRHNGIIWTAEFDPKGHRIITASADRSAMVWDVESRQPLVRPIRHERGVAGARFSPDGQWALTWSDDGMARIWNSHSGEPVSQPMRHRDKVTAADFSPDGARVVTGSKDGVVRLWDAASGYPLSEPLQGGGQIRVVEFSPDGRRFLGYGDSLKIWDVITPPVPVPDWFCDVVEAVAGKRLTASRDPEPVSRDSFPPLRQRFASVGESDFYSRWANWFLWERIKDPAPEFLP